MNTDEKHFTIGNINIINDNSLKYLATLDDNSIEKIINVFKSI